MPIARSTKYPNLHAFAAKVRFKNGEAEVSEEQAGKLRKLPAKSGVVVDDEAPAKKATSAKKATGGADG